MTQPQPLDLNAKVNNTLVYGTNLEISRRTSFLFLSLDHFKWRPYTTRQGIVIRSLYNRDIESRRDDRINCGKILKSKN